jgi:hypothetical protein
MTYAALFRGILFIFVLSSVAFAQGQVGPNDACRHWDVNRTGGVAGVDFPISTSPVTVVAVNQSLCGALISNRSVAGQPVRCRSIQAGAPTGTIGYQLLAGEKLGLGLEAQSGVQCVRDSTATADTTVNSAEIYP